MINNENKLSIKDEKNTLKLLWECCQIPDFVKKSYGKHLEIVKKYLIFIRDFGAKYLNSYLKEQLKPLINLMEMLILYLIELLMLGPGHTSQINQIG